MAIFLGQHSIAAFNCFFNRPVSSSWQATQVISGLAQHPKMGLDFIEPRAEPTLTFLRPSHGLYEQANPIAIPTLLIKIDDILI